MLRKINIYSLDVILSTFLLLKEMKVRERAGRSQYPNISPSDSLTESRFLIKILSIEKN